MHKNDTDGTVTLRAKASTAASRQAELNIKLTNVFESYGAPKDSHEGLMRVASIHLSEPKFRDRAKVLGVDKNPNKIGLSAGDYAIKIADDFFKSHPLMQAKRDEFITVVTTICLWYKHACSSSKLFRVSEADQEPLAKLSLDDAGLSPPQAASAM